MPAWGSLSLLEGVWLLVAIAGSIYSGINLRTALRQRYFIQQRHLNGGRRLVTDGNVRRESLRLLGLLACFLLGAYAASPPPLQAPFVGWLAPLLLVTVMGSMALSSFLDERENAALLVLLRVVDHYTQKNDAHAAGEHPA